MAHTRTPHRPPSGFALAEGERADGAGRAPGPTYAAAGMTATPLRWAYAKAWLDGAARRIALQCSGAIPPMAALEEELGRLIRQADDAGFLNDLPRGHSTALARQIATWFARRDSSAAERLTRSSLAMLIAGPTFA